jgi:hypothetical protein
MIAPPAYHRGAGMIDHSLEPPMLDVGTYAETLARLQHHPPASTPQILKRLALTEPQWASIRARWIALIEDDMARGGALAIAFASTFSATRRRLLERGESLPSEMAPEKALSPQPDATDPWAGLPQAMRGFTSMAGTEIGGNAPTQPALPFAPTTTHGDDAKARPSAPTVADPWAGLPQAMRGFTSMAGTEIGGNAPTQPALPFNPANAPAGGGPPGGLTMEQAVSLHVDLASPQGGASPADVLRRYGLTEDQHQALARYWAGRTATEPSVRERWERACGAYRAWLLGHQPR